MTAVRLLTFNALFKGDVRARLHALAERLSGYDVVCLQEVMYRSHAALLGLSARHSGAVLLKGGLVLLSRWPVRSYRFVAYPYARPARPEWLMRKGAQVATVATPHGDLVVVNTHLSANRDDDWSPDNRWTRVQAGELDRLTTALAGIDPTVPLVAVGDFNQPPRLLAGFAAANGLRDAMPGDRGPTYRPTPSWPEPPALDHVLVRGGLTARTRLVFQDPVRLADGREAYLSDHYGIEADLST